MNRKLVFAATVASSLLAVAPAQAATVNGTIVARDAQRGTVVAVGRAGNVLTLRVKRARSFHPGQRVRARATLAADGTYAVSRVARRGRAGSARLRATVVRRQGRHYVVTAGGSTFAVRAARRGSAAAGAVIRAELRLRGRSVLARTVAQVGTADTLEIEGIFLGLADGTLRLAVEGAGEVAVAVPEGFEVPAEPGDELELEVAVAVAEDGTLELVAFDDEGDDDEAEDSGDDADDADDDEYGDDEPVDDDEPGDDEPDDDEV